MSKKNLRITISGESGTGKTSVAIAIANFLKPYGFEVEVNDEDINSGYVPKDIWAKSVAKLPDTTSIYIETLQLKRK